MRVTTCVIQTERNGALAEDSNAAPHAGYFSDWRTRLWSCPCGWTGTNADGVVHCSDAAVGTECPNCRLAVARVDRIPSREQVEQAAGLGKAEAAALSSPEDFGSPYADDRGTARFIAGNEEVVFFQDGDQFFGVSLEWLLPRLRLDPACGQIDILEGGPIIVLDNEIQEDLDIYAMLGADEASLCAYDNGGNTGAPYSIAGGWLISFAAEDRHTLTWIGTGSHDLRQLALDKLSEAMSDWMPGPHERCDVTSPYLQAHNAEDVGNILVLAGEASPVSLNGIVIRESEPDGPE